MLYSGMHTPAPICEHKYINGHSISDSSDSNVLCDIATTADTSFPKASAGTAATEATILLLLKLLFYPVLDVTAVMQLQASTTLTADTLTETRKECPTLFMQMQCRQ
jgi:hypothetical protein